MELPRSRFDLDQRVWPVAFHSTQHWEACGFCGGSKKIVGLDLTERHCGACAGRGEVSVSTPMGWHVGAVRTIGQVRLTLTDARHKASLRKPPELVQFEYMCAETGIGSGTVYHEKDLFPSVESAQDECDRRTAEKVRP